MANPKMTPEETQRQRLSIGTGGASCCVVLDPSVIAIEARYRYRGSIAEVWIMEGPGWDSENRP